MAFKIQITCPDCTYEDYQGCGEGYPFDYGEPDLFDTREAAQAEADKLEREGYGGIWEFEVKECEPAAGAPEVTAAPEQLSEKEKAPEGDGDPVRHSDRRASHQTESPRQKEEVVAAAAPAPIVRGEGK